MPRVKVTWTTSDMGASASGAKHSRGDTPRSARHASPWCRLESRRGTAWHGSSSTSRFSSGKPERTSRLTARMAQTMKRRRADEGGIVHEASSGSSAPSLASWSHFTVGIQLFSLDRLCMLTMTIRPRQTCLVERRLSSRQPRCCQHPAQHRLSLLQSKPSFLCRRRSQTDPGPRRVARRPAQPAIRPHCHPAHSVSLPALATRRDSRTPRPVSRLPSSASLGAWLAVCHRQPVSAHLVSH